MNVKQGFFLVISILFTLALGGACILFAFVRDSAETPRPGGLEVMVFLVAIMCIGALLVGFKALWRDDVDDPGDLFP